VHKHSIDLVSLVAGLLFLALAAGYVASDISDITLDARFLIPIALVVLGLGGLAASIQAQRRSE